MKRSVVIGLGNPILRDDGAGIRAARRLKERLPAASDVVVKEVPSGGLRLMEQMAGYERAVIIDAIQTGQMPGTVHVLAPSDVLSTKNSVSSHDTNLSQALEMGRMLGLPVPSDIGVIGIEAVEVESFGEELTEEVERAVEAAASRALEYLRRQ